MHVEKFFARGRCFGKDTEPSKRIVPLVHGERTLGERRTGNAVKTIAADDEFAPYLMDISILLDSHRRPSGVDAVQRNGPALEAQIAAIGEAPSNEILHDFLLAVNGDAPAGELDEGDTMARAVHAKLNAFVPKAIPVEAFGDTGLTQHLDAGVLQDAGAHPLLAISARPRFENDGTDPVQVQKMRQHESRGTCADNPDLDPR